MDAVSQYLEMGTYIITILGVPAAIFVYLQEQKLQRQEREYGTFDALDNKYIEVQQLCLEYPELDIFDTPYENPVPLTAEQEKQEEAILLIRISIFERAFLMYKSEGKKMKSDQWDGWEAEIFEWMDRDNFRKIWDLHSPYYDREFARYFNKGASVDVKLKQAA